MKKKLYIRVTALLLCLCACLSFAACTSGEDDGVPDGMQIATCVGEDFRLYIPTTWNVNIAYGISGGYYSTTEQSSVSVVKYAINAEMESAMAASELVSADDATTRMLWYFETAIYTQLKVLDEEVERYEADCISTVLGGVNALQYHHSMAPNGEEIHFLHVIAERAGAFYVFSFTAVESLYDSLYADNKSGSNVANILKEFKFAEPYRSVENEKALDTETQAPDGMKLASNGDVAYLFFVPTSWNINTADGIFSAKSADGLAVVSVTPYMPDREISVQGYFERCEAQLQSNVTAYERISEEKGTLGGGTAMVYEYKYTVGSTEFQAKQALVGYGGMIYSLTYTSRTADYQTNMEDAERIFAEFAFRRT